MKNTLIRCFDNHGKHGVGMGLEDKHSKIVVMSGAGIESFKGLSKFGIHSLLKKPFSMAELEARFHEVAAQ